jgi:hypothetical protein
MRSFLGWRGVVLPALVKPFLCVLILSVLAAAKDKDATLPGRCSAVAVDAQKIGVARKWSVILQPIVNVANPSATRSAQLVIFEDLNMGKMYAAGVALGGLGEVLASPKLGRMLMETDGETCRISVVRGKPAQAMLKALQETTEPVAIPKADSHANSEPSPFARISTSESASNSRGSIGAFSDNDPTIRHDGVQLTRVTPGGPADSAGIQVSDLAVDNHYIYTGNELTHAIQALCPDSHVAIRYQRRASIVDTYLTVQREP